MIRSSSPTTDVMAMNVVSPLLNDCSIPAKVKSSEVIATSIKAVYGALAISKAIRNIGLAYPISKANKELLASNVNGFSASVIGPPKTRNNCQTVIKKRIAHAIYCITSNAFVTNGKYSSIAVRSVFNVFKNSPETASISCDTILEIHLTIPSNIQSSNISHLRP